MKTVSKHAYYLIWIVIYSYLKKKSFIGRKSNFIISRFSTQIIILLYCRIQTPQQFIIIRSFNTFSWSYLSLSYGTVLIGIANINFISLIIFKKDFALSSFVIILKNSQSKEILLLKHTVRHRIKHKVIQIHFIKLCFLNFVFQRKGNASKIFCFHTPY